MNDKENEEVKSALNIPCVCGHLIYTHRFSANNYCIECAYTKKYKVMAHDYVPDNLAFMEWKYEQQLK